MNTTVRDGAVVILLVLFAACGGSGPTSPTGTNPPPALQSPTPPTPTNFPPVSGPSRTFVFDRELSYHVSDYTRESRFILYDNGAFVLQYPSLVVTEYRGEYKAANSVLGFWWVVGDKPGATGSLEGNFLTVRYDLINRIWGSEDAVYRLMP